MHEGNRDEIKIGEVLERYLLGERNFRNLKLVGNKHLEEEELYGEMQEYSVHNYKKLKENPVDFSNSDFSGIYATGLKVPFGVFRNTDLSHSVLTGMELPHGTIDGANFRDSMLYGANFSECQGKTIRVTLNDGSTIYKKVDFTRSFLQGAVFKDARLYHPLFNDTYAPDVDFQYARLDRPFFRKAKLQHSDFSYSHVIKPYIDESTNLKHVLICEMRGKRAMEKYL